MTKNVRYLVFTLVALTLGGVGLALATYVYRISAVH